MAALGATVEVDGVAHEVVVDRKAGTVTVAGKAGVNVPPGTLNSIRKQAGLK